MSLWRTAAIVGAGLSGLALGMTLINLRTWPRGRPGARLRDPRDERDEEEGGERLSVLVPARDEEGSIEACVRAIARSSHPVDEIVVFDDGSTDQTPEILARLGDQIDQLRVLEGGQGLPPGWVGKPHACHRLAEAATGDVLLFVDADTMLTREGVGRIISLMQDLEADAVTAVPHQMTGSWAERLILPLLHLTYTSWFPLALTWLSQDVRFLAANGQVLAMRRRAHDDVGGFAAVRGEVVDDMAICRRLKAAGWRVVFADGDQIATCRMYGSARQVWEGFSKNLYEGIGAHPLALAGVIGLYGAAFILPYVALAASRARPDARAPALLGVLHNAALRAALWRRFGHAPESVLLHPVSVAGLLAIAVNSARWYARDQITWAGRTYGARASRAAQADDEAPST